MRRIATLFVLFHLGTSAGLVASGFTIHRIPLEVPTRAEHKRYCGAEAHALGCTLFTGAHATFTCRSVHRGWRIEASAELLAIVVLRRLDGIRLQREVVEHENAHIEDVRTSVLEGLDELENQRFASESECRDRVAQEEAKFPVAVRASIQASRALRD